MSKIFFFQFREIETYLVTVRKASKSSALPRCNVNLKSAWDNNEIKCKIS